MQSIIKSRLTSKNNINDFWKFLGNLIVPAAFILLVFFFYPERASFELNEDEGINLIKASLVANDYALYDEIWSDQPPLLTYLLAGVYKLLGADVGTGRMLILLFTGMMIWSAYLLLETLWGWRTAVISVILFILLPGLIELSVSVMIGLPAISLGMMSILFRSQAPCSRPSIAVSNGRTRASASKTSGPRTVSK